jgi:hypothetical protein
MIALFRPDTAIHSMHRYEAATLGKKNEETKISEIF